MSGCRAYQMNLIRPYEFDDARCGRPPAHIDDVTLGNLMLGLVYGRILDYYRALGHGRRYLRDYIHFFSTCLTDLSSRGAERE